MMLQRLWSGQGELVVPVKKSLSLPLHQCSRTAANVPGLECAYECTSVTASVHVQGKTIFLSFISKKTHAILTRGFQLEPLHCF